KDSARDRFCGVNPVDGPRRGLSHAVHQKRVVRAGKYDDVSAFAILFIKAWLDLSTYSSLVYKSIAYIVFCERCEPLTSNKTHVHSGRPRTDKIARILTFHGARCRQN